VKNQSGYIEIWMTEIRIYHGTVAWGWRMYGIGYKTKWFFGFSIQVTPRIIDTKIIKFEKP